MNSGLDSQRRVLRRGEWSVRRGEMKGGSRHPCWMIDLYRSVFRNVAFLKLDDFLNLDEWESVLSFKILFQHILGFVSCDFATITTFTKTSDSISLERPGSWPTNQATNLRCPPFSKAYRLLMEKGLRLSAACTKDGEEISGLLLPRQSLGFLEHHPQVSYTWEAATYGDRKSH